MIKRYFQWLDGEDAGKVEILDGITYECGTYFLKFVSGEVMNMEFVAAQTRDSNSLKNKLMVEIQDPYDLWTYREIKPRTELLQNENGEEVVYEIPPISDIANADMSGGGGTVTNSVVGKKYYIAPRWRGTLKPLPTPEEYMKENPIEEKEYTNPSTPIVESIISNTNEKEKAQRILNKEDIKPRPELTPESIVAAQAQHKMETDPVYILVNSSAKEEKDLNVTIKVALPSKELYGIIAKQFDGGAQKFSTCIANMLKDALSDENILKSLKDSIMQAYEN